MRVFYKLFGCCLCVWMSAVNATTPDGFSMGESAIPFKLEYDNQKDLSGSLHRYYYNTQHGALRRHNGTPITEFSLHKDFVGSMFHYRRTQSDQEQQQLLGLSRGNTTVAYFNGIGNSFLKSNNALYPDLNHYFAHGGTRSTFDFKGAGINYGFTEGLSAQLVGVRISSPNVDTRSAYYTGVSGRRFDAGYFQLRRDRESAGNGFNLSFTGDYFGFDVRQIRTATEVHVRHIGLSWSENSRSSFAVSYEDARNPLYTDGDDQRVMFRYQRVIGGSITFKAAEEEKPAVKRNNALAAIGAGIGAAAIFSTSGDKSNDASARFASENVAGVSVLNNINPTSVAQNLEYGGWVFRNADGTFGHTAPVKGSVASVNIGTPSVVPAGTAAVASYHTHGGPDPRFVNNEFSASDLESDRSVGVNGFLGTPESCGTEDSSSGCAKKHVVTTGAVIVLGPIAN